MSGCSSAPWQTLLVRTGSCPAVSHVAIDNPPLGILNQAVRRELGSFFLAAQDDPQLRCIVFDSGPRDFCAGADLHEYAQRMDSAVARAHVHNAQRMMLALVELDVPTIASIRGACMGGGLELALGCCYRVASRNAVLALPEVKRGAWPGTGGIPLLQRQVRPSLAKRLVYTGASLDAAAAHAVGLIDEVVEDEALDERAQVLAAEFASQPKSSIQTMSRLMDRDFRSAFRAHLEYEEECFVHAYQLPAAREGYEAFFDKRMPVWRQG